MAKVYIEVTGATDQEEPVTMSKSGDPFKLLTEARMMLRRMQPNIAHITLCMCDCEEDDDAPAHE